MSTTPTTSAQSGSQLNGVGWLTDLLKTVTAGYVAIETVKAEKRTPGSVTTQTTPRVEPAPSMLATPEGKRTAIIVGALVGLLVLLLVIRRK